MTYNIYIWCYLLKEIAAHSIYAINNELLSNKYKYIYTAIFVGKQKIHIMNHNL